MRLDHAHRCIYMKFQEAPLDSSVSPGGQELAFAICHGFGHTLATLFFLEEQTTAEVTYSFLPLNAPPSLAHYLYNSQKPDRIQEVLYTKDIELVSGFPTI